MVRSMRSASMRVKGEFKKKVLFDKKKKKGFVYRSWLFYVPLPFGFFAFGFTDFGGVPFANLRAGHTRL